MRKEIEISQKTDTPVYIKEVGNYGRNIQELFPEDGSSGTLPEIKLANAGKC